MDASVNTSAGSREVEHGLVEVWQTVEAGHHEVPRLHHLTGDFGVATFVGIEEPMPAQAPAEGDCGDEEQPGEPCEGT